MLAVGENFKAVRWPISRCPLDRVDDLKAIPGVAIRGAWITASPDLADRLSSFLGQGVALLDSPPIEKLSLRSDRKVTASPQPVDNFRSLFPWQVEAASKLSDGSRIGLWHATGCISADTKIPVLESNGQIAYRTLGSLASRPKFMLAETRTLSYCKRKPRGIVLNEITAAIHHPAMKRVLLVSTSEGDSVAATEDHRFLLPNGTWMGLEELGPGDEVMASRLLGYPPERVRIDSIAFAGLRNVVDLSMAAPHHNFVAGGFIVANSGKSLSLMSAAEAVNAKRIVTVTRSIGRDVYARDSVRLRQKRRIAIVAGTGKAAGQVRLNSIRKSDERLDSYRAKGADALVVGSVESALAHDPWMTVIPWETLHHHIDPLKKLLRDEPTLLIFDEHHMAKGRLSKRTKTAHTLSSLARLVWSATATPIRDRARDLWAQLVATRPHATWGPNFAWVHRYCAARPGRYGGLDTSGLSNLPELTARLDYWFDIVTRKEIAHLLPRKTRNIIRLDASHVAKALEESGDSRDWSRRGLEAALAVAAAAKREYLVDRTVEALCGDEKLIVVGNRRDWVARTFSDIRKGVTRIPKVSRRLWLGLADGAVPVPDRQKIAAEFMRVQGPACLVATMDSISESIDLHDADRMIVAALPYTVGQVVQLEGRVCRAGGRRPVSIDYLIAEGSVDEHVEDLLIGKLSAAEDAGATTEVDGVFRSVPDENEIVERLIGWLRAKEET